jgi:hypothetical protein
MRALTAPHRVDDAASGMVDMWREREGQVLIPIASGLKRHLEYRLE